MQASPDQSTPPPVPRPSYETQGGADHFRHSIVPVTSCFFPHMATAFGLVDRLSPGLEACFPTQGIRWIESGADPEGADGSARPTSEPKKTSEDSLLCGGPTDALRALTWDLATLLLEPILTLAYPRYVASLATIYTANNSAC